jgi:hypothetical protein
MKRLSAVALVSFAALAACSIKEERIVQQPAPAASTVVATPAPAGSTTVYTTPAPATTSTTVYTR